MAKENRTKEILALGGRVWKIKIHPAREYAVVIKENCTKADMRLLEFFWTKTNFICQRIRRGDQGKSHQGISPVGG